MADAFYKLYPESHIGGFSRENITIAFYNLVNAAIEPDDIVVDLGAGRGQQIEDVANRHARELITLKGKCKRLIGLDVDTAVLSNPFLDEAHVIDPSRPLPLADESVDVIYADWVLEHVEHPSQFAAEVQRVLKQGGWFCARTPNKWGIIGIAGRSVPNSLHVRLLKHLQPGRKEVDVFPTYHRMNSLGRISHYFPKSHWNNYSFNYGFEVGYFGRFLPLAWIGYLYNKVVPNPLGLVTLAFVQKKPSV